jgi:beta-N-acetylhexosaminidase
MKQIFVLGIGIIVIGLGGWWQFFQPTTIPVTQTNDSPELAIAQLFMIGHWTNTPTEITTAMIEEYGFGGVVIMDAPDDPSLLTTWIAQWNSVSDVPLLIAIDQEGGPVTRLKGEAFIQTSQRDITDTEHAYDTGKIRGQQLAALGITMNFAPVLDGALNSSSFMYSRTFKSTTDSSALAAAMIAGMKSESIIAVAKHFPGHDDTSSDSHYVLPTVDISRSDLDTFTKPFSTLFRTNPPEAIMTAHVLFPEIDALPVTLSEFFLTTYLRDTLGYQNVIITDDVSMDAIDQQWDTSQAAVMSLGAGADIILFAAEPHRAAEALTAVTIAAEMDDDFRQKLILSQARVQKLRN